MRKGDATQSRIVEAAFVTIRKYGTFSFTLEQVAQGAQVQRQAIINYFGGKEGLIRVCILKILEDFAVEYAARLRPNHSALDQLDLQFKMNQEMALHQSERARLVLFLYLHAALDPELQPIYNEAISRIRSRYHSMVEAGVREGVFRSSIRPELVGALLHECIVGIVINVLAHDGKPSEVKASSEKWKLVLNAFRADGSRSARKNRLG